MKSPETEFARLPGVDQILRRADIRAGAKRFGRELMVEAVRYELAILRAEIRNGGKSKGKSNNAPPARPGTSLPKKIADNALAWVETATSSSLRPVLNLTGTVIHTNLGRAPLPEVAIEAMARAARSPVNLEFDLDTGKRGERDRHVEGWLIRLTGAEAALLVNNNAAAVLLALNTLAHGREVPVSRGELIEIGGSFRLPEIMARAGCRLVEVGTTNRTHLNDFARALNKRTGAIMSAHTSNYVIQGFTAAPAPAALSALAHEHGVPWIHDLGSGTLVPLESFGLPHETTAREMLDAGADLVTFSGDKLLGGPQVGVIAGRAELIDELRRNPMKRALRVDKLTIAALSALLPLYANPERLLKEVPVLRHLTRKEGELRKLAEQLAKFLGPRLRGYKVEAASCASRIGSGALPIETLPSVALAIRPESDASPEHSVERLAAAMRDLPQPVIGRIHDGALLLDLRCLEHKDHLPGALKPLLQEPARNRPAATKKRR